MPDRPEPSPDRSPAPAVASSLLRAKLLEYAARAPRLDFRRALRAATLDALRRCACLSGEDAEGSPRRKTDHLRP